LGSRVGAVVRALAFHSAPRGFSPGTPVFPSPQKPTFNLIGFDLFDLMI